MLRKNFTVLANTVLMICLAALATLAMAQILSVLSPVLTLLFGTVGTWYAMKRQQTALVLIGLLAYVSSWYMIGFFEAWIAIATSLIGIFLWFFGVFRALQVSLKH